jgi:hypothetical protein
MPSVSFRNGRNACVSSGWNYTRIKTRLVEFGRFAAEDRKRRGEGKPETFNFLGFTHICAKNQKTGGFSVDRKTIRKRLSAKLKAVREELRRRWHEPVAEVGKWLRSVVQGYFNYHAVPGNIDSLQSFRAQVVLVPRAPTAEPEESDALGAFRSACCSVDPECYDPAPASC